MTGQWALHVKFTDGRGACVPLDHALVAEYTSRDGSDIDWDSIYSEMVEVARQLADDTEADTEDFFGSWTEPVS